MNCKEILSRLHAYIDGELSKEVRRAMDEHLSACPTCQREVERLRQLGDSLDNLSVPPPPNEFVARIMAEAEKRIQSDKRKNLFFPWEWQPVHWLSNLSGSMRLAACSVVLVACFLGVLMSKEISQSDKLQVYAAEEENLEGVEWFGPVPPVSLSSVYLSLASTAPEDRGTR